MILPCHVSYFEEIFALPGFLADPVLVFGLQDAWKSAEVPTPQSELLCHPDLNAYLRARGLRVLTMDHFDPRADLRYDMNEPVPVNEHGQYSTLIDIGCLEHVFDTRQCLENCLRMVKIGGHYLLHTPINGYFGHGLHTFNPGGLTSALELNGFEIVYHRFSTSFGEVVSDPVSGGDVLLWLVGKKVGSIDRFVCPQQGGWNEMYRDPSRSLGHTQT